MQESGRLCLPLCEGTKEVGARGYRWAVRGGVGTACERQN